MRFRFWGGKKGLPRPVPARRPIGPVEALADLASPDWRKDREERCLQAVSPSAEEDISLRGVRLRGFQRNAPIDLEPGTKGLFRNDIDPDRSF